MNGAEVRESERGNASGVDGPTDQPSAARALSSRWLSRTSLPAACCSSRLQTRALAALDVTEIPFAGIDGNCQGYAVARSVAVSPVAALPFKTFFHELAHVLLGHTTEAELTDDERTPRDLREVEAEATAMLVCAALGLPGVEFSRGYIQHWHQSGQPIPERSAQKILKVADQILRAGRPADSLVAEG